MSLHFIIDGYNLIKQTPILNKENLEDSREALFGFLRIHRPQGNNCVTVVFDGRQGKTCQGDNPGIGVIFSQGQSADDKIKRLVKDAKNSRNVVVVTNDREIQSFSRQHRAQVKGVEEFLAKLNSGRTKAEPEDKTILSPRQAAKITDEMRDLWLKK